MGIDLGIVNIASDSQKNRYSGARVNSWRKRHLKLRRKLQNKETKSAKKLLKKRSKKEQRFVRNQNHIISKKILKTAQRHSLSIALEDLRGIRQRATVKKEHRYALHY